jgi:hypothetical protein
MNHAKGYSDITLNLFGGVDPEMAPRALPEGASPRCQDVDFQIGAVLTRAGLSSVYAFSSDNFTENTNLGQNIGSTGIAWANPNNVTLNSPPSYAAVTLVTGLVYGFSTFDQSSAHNGTAGPQVGGSLTPSTPSGWAIESNFSEGSYEDVTGFTQIFSSTGNVIGMMPLSSTTPVGWSNTVPTGGWNTNLLLFNGFSYPIVCSLLSVQVVSNVVTITTSPQTFIVGTQIQFPSGLNSGFLNSALVKILSNTGTSITFAFTHADAGPTAETAAITNFPYLQQVNANAVNSNTAGQTQALTLPNNVTPGSTILVFLAHGDVNSFCTIASVSDGTNSYSVSNSQGNGSGADPGSFENFAWATNLASGSLTVTTTAGSYHNPSAGGRYVVMELPGGSGTGGAASSKPLSVTNFNLNIPATVQPLGMTLELDGLQNQLTVGDNLTVSLINPATGSPTFTTQLQTTQGSATVGTPTSSWGLTLTPGLLNNPNFGFLIVAKGVDIVTFNLSAAKLTVYGTPVPPQNFNYIKTFGQTDGDTSTLALDAAGTLWAEDVVNNPLVLSPIYTAIEPNTFAKSVTAQDREYLALSNLSNGTDMPRQWTGQWMDRLSQVGPGAGPTITSTGGGYPLLATNGITQNAAINYTGLGLAYGILLSAGPGNFTSPGNVLTFYLKNSFTLPAYFQTGSNIVLSNMPTLNNTFDVNNGHGTNPAYYTIVGPVGQPPGPPTGDTYTAFSVIVPFNGFVNGSIGPGFSPGGLTFQATVATAVTTTQVPNLQVGNQFAISGTSVSGYDNTWTVLTTPNADQLSITSTSLTGDLATYTYSIISGSAPAAGEFVSVTGTTNGGGIFNVGQAVIQSVTISSPTTGSFAIGIASPNVPPAAESANGIIAGTIFTFDPLAILGNSNGGSIVVAGTIASGPRQACVSFLTRNGYVTKPSPIVNFTVSTGASAIAATTIPTGPSNVVARIVSFTGASGGFFFNIPKPVTVISNGVSTIETSTWINDNTTTSAIFSFSDATLLAADSIDSQGNDWFNQKELGSSVGLISYASRLFAIGEQNKVNNLLNFSFDGGIGTAPTTLQTYPLGWVIDPTNGAGGSVATSPIFGNAYSIINASGSTQALYGMITQNAYQDEFLVPIIAPSTTYSVRVTASSPNLSTVGNLMVDLFQPSTMTILGSYTLGLAHLTSNMNIFSGTLLTVPITPATGAGTVPPPPVTPFYAAGLVQHIGQSETTNTNLFITLPNPVTAGNTLILTFDSFNYNLAPVITDTVGNNWIQIVHQNTSGQDHNSYIYAVSGAKAGPTSINIEVFNSNFNSFITAVVGELNGLLIPLSLDGTGTNFYGGSNTGSINTGSVTTVNAHDVIITGFSNGPTIPSGYTLIGTTSINAAGGTQQYSAAFDVVSTTGTYTPTWPYTGNSAGTGVTAAFRLVQQNAPAPIVPTTIPSDLLLRVYGANLPNGTQILIDRVEVFPTEQPVLSTQLTASYVDNLEAFDVVTGDVDASVQNQQPVTNAFTIFDKLYILKSDSLFSTEDNGTTEPNGWGVKEDSNRIGCVGIHALDYGEEWAVFAHRTGLYVFYGGEPKKISQEVQKIWDLINWAAGTTIWVRNDISNRRILIGVPLSTPNTWLPNAPINNNPTTPNVILMMNYKEINSVQDLAIESPIHVTYANKIVSKDIARKWSIWTIVSPYGDFIKRPDGTSPIFLCNGAGNSKIYQFLDTNHTDDGNMIPWLYTTFGFVKQDFAQGLNIGQHRKIFTYLSMAIDGTGDTVITALPDQIDSTYANALAPITLSNPSTDNVEIPLNETGTRLFLQFAGNTPGSWFYLQELTMTLGVDPWSPVRGGGS